MSSEGSRVIDAAGRRIEVGDRVRVLGVPDLSGMSPARAAESRPVFEPIVGSSRRVCGFGRLGHVERMVRIRAGPHAGLHVVEIEPGLVRVRRRRGR